MKRKVAPQNASQKPSATKAPPALEQNPRAVAFPFSRGSASNQCLQFGVTLVPSCLGSSIPAVCHEPGMSQPVRTSSSHPLYANPAAL